MAKAYVDGWGDHHQRDSIFIHEDGKSAKVTYRSESGRKFSVVVHAKPNPIGFRASLPGDRRLK